MLGAGTDWYGKILKYLKSLMLYPYGIHKLYNVILMYIVTFWF